MQGFFIDGVLKKLVNIKAGDLKAEVGYILFKTAYHDFKSSTFQCTGNLLIQVA
jgi:hypothetical protein